MDNIFNLPDNATKEQITRRWRELLLQCHPDHGGSEEVFHQVMREYKSLMDAKKNEVCSYCKGTGKVLVGSRLSYIYISCPKCCVHS